MNGQMMNYDLEERLEKDRIAQEFIKEINPYQSKPSLGIDLRALTKKIKEENISMAEMSKEEIAVFAIN